MDDVSASFRRTRHAADDELLDYARETGDAARRAELASHLEAGCRRCADTLRLWVSAVDAAGRDRAYDVPDALLRQVKGAFSVHRPDARPLLASLVFDSFLQPLAAGVRASAAGPRQLFYKAGRYAVRLRTEPVADSGRLLLVGQVFDEDDPAGALGDIGVLIFRKNATMDRTLTNRLGEFVFETMPDADGLRIAIGVRDHGFLTVALPAAGKRGDETRRSRLNWK
jgi:hypothetical protein